MLRARLIGVRGVNQVNKAIFLVSLILSVSLAYSAETDTVKTQLKNALVDAFTKLGQVEPWQKKIFDEEVMMQYQRFIRDYRQTGPNLSVEVDLDSLKKYLRFQAKKTDAQAWVYLRAQPSCGRCGASFEDIKKLVKERLERRGFVPTWLTPEEIGDVNLAGKALNDRVYVLAKNKNAGAALVVQWQLAPIDDIDTAHADEEHFQITSWFTLRDLAKNENKLELLSTDSFLIFASRLLTDAFTELGGKVDALQVADGSSGKDEIALEINGVRDFVHFAMVKAQVQGRLKDVIISGPEERRIARGKATLAVFTSKSVDDIRGALGKIQLDNGTLTVVGAKERTIQMEIQ